MSIDDGCAKSKMGRNHTKISPILSSKSVMFYQIKFRVNNAVVEL
jgi:hypothetical protein